MKPLSPNPDTVQAFRLHDDGTFPNHPKWPRQMYRSAVTRFPGARANRNSETMIRRRCAR